MDTTERQRALNRIADDFRELPYASIAPPELTLDGTDEVERDIVRPLRDGEVDGVLATLDMEIEVHEMAGNMRKADILREAQARLQPFTEVAA